MITNEELYKKFPVKYGRDAKDNKTPGDIVKDIAQILDKDPDDHEKYADCIDREFLFGAWGEASKGLPSLFLKDIRGVIRTAYLRGKLEACFETEETMKEDT